MKQDDLIFLSRKSLYALPSGDIPYAIADLVNEVYEVDSSAVAVTDMFGEATDWGAFNPAHIVNGTGYAPQDEAIDGAIKLIDDALEASLTEGTILIEFELLEIGDLQPSFSVHDPDFLVEYTLTMLSGNDYTVTDNMGGSLILDANANTMTAGIHTVAINIRDGGFAGSLDQSVAEAREAVAWTPAPTEFWILVPYGGCILRKIGIWPTQPDNIIHTLVFP